MKLDTQLTDAFPLRVTQKQALETLGIETVEELLYHFPHRFENRDQALLIKDLEDDMQVTVFGQLVNLETKKSRRKGIPMTTATLTDGTGSVDVVWFHQAYIGKMIADGQAVKLTGTFKKKASGLSVANPEFSEVAGDEIDLTSGSFVLPVYPRVKGISSKWLYHKIKRILADKDLLTKLEDPIPELVRKELSLPDIQTAMIWIHAPKKLAHAQVAKKRFAFEEVFAVQLVKRMARRALDAEESFEIPAEYDSLGDFLERFDFEPTGAQQRAIREILADLASPHAMSRLLEGDVGSGKTFVAAASAYATVTTPPKGRDYGSLQVAYMAPTEILARQQFAGFVEMFAHLPIEMGLITGSGCRKFPSKVDDTQATDISRTQLLRWIKAGVVSMVIGTHSLIQKEVQFENLAYVIIDEQHRFGINQRAELVKKDGPLPHLLSMTATPIPRTLALTAYGDLDLSVIDERPPGRQNAKTELVKEARRGQIYEKLREKLAAGQQAYVICPRIDKPDPDDSSALDVMSVEEMTEKLKKEFSEFSVTALHGRMNNKEKEQIMEQFDEGDTDILVSTSVVEVGVNVPNATTIIIENAENFGLAQLHQLRGRVERSSQPAHCFLFANVQADRTAERLKALEENSDGFALAEQDLAIRGPGALIGSNQSGLADIAMAALENLPLVQAASEAANKILDDDPQLENHPQVAARISRLQELAHFE